MTDYVKSTNFTSKDSLASGNPLKIVKGTEFDIEFNNIAVAVATKADVLSPALTGTPTAPTATAGTSTAQVATTSFVGTAVSNAVTAYDAALTVSTAQIEDSAVTAAKLASGAAVSNIGFTPVQQGGGTGQGTNKVYIGWGSSNQLRLTIDTTDFGINWPINADTVATVTTTQVLNATAGASAGAVGTYAFLGDTNSTGYAFGDTAAGSTLRYAGLRAGSSFENAIPSAGTFGGGTGGPTGTWRCMGNGNAGTGSFRATLWLRIS